MDVASNDNPEVCLIDSGIDSLYNVPLYPHITSLNLHSNHLQKIENLHRLSLLRHLDLSSNQIYRIDGLDALQNLCTLNLSCNKLALVEGLSNLRNLVKINLSFNLIMDISGFYALSGPAYKLSTVALHGNYIEHISDLRESLASCTNLRTLILSQEGADNPVCQMASYPAQVLASLPQLNLLDNQSRTGQTGRQLDILADVPGLEEFLDYLSTGNSMKVPESLRLVTPQIDKVLDRYHNRATTVIPENSMLLTSTSSEAPSTPSLHVSGISTRGAPIAKGAVRTSQRENANSSMESAHTSDQSHAQKSSVHEVPSKDTDAIEISDSGTDSQSGSVKKQRRRKKTRLPSYRKSTAASRARKETRAACKFGGRSCCRR